jgi:soluble lytic murein transglycosylase-like protein
MEARPSIKAAPAAAATAAKNGTRDVLAAYIASTYRKPFDYARHIVDLTYEVAQKRSLPVSLLLAMMAKESAFDASVRSPQGALGLLQVIPRYHRDRLTSGETDASLKHPPTNIRVGADILSELLEEEGSLDAALLRYSGNSRGYARRVHAYWRKLQAVEALSI